MLVAIQAPAGAVTPTPTPTATATTTPTATPTVTATATANGRQDTVERVLRAYRKAVHDYSDAFIAPDGTRRNGPTAPQVLAIIAKYAEQPVEEVDIGVPYFDREARLDVDDVLHQIAWYQGNGMVKGSVNGAALIDKRYVVATPKAAALVGGH